MQDTTGVVLCRLFRGGDAGGAGAGAGTGRGGEMSQKAGGGGTMDRGL